jgi:uncharacterized membrane protein
MARPKTLGPPIQFRLPIDLHAVAEQRAALNGMTVNEYLANRLVDALTRQRDADTIVATAEQVAVPPARYVTPRWKTGMKNR